MRGLKVEILDYGNIVRISVQPANHVPNSSAGSALDRDVYFKLLNRRDTPQETVAKLRETADWIEEHHCSDSEPATPVSETPHFKGE